MQDACARRRAALVAPGKGILAADESDGTIGAALRGRRRRVDRGEHGAPTASCSLATPGIEERLSGVILFDETIRQRASDGTPFPELLAAKGIVPGIKVDRGAKPLALADGETVTEGLDGLRERLEEYRGLGARFAKWRAVYSIGDGPAERVRGVGERARARALRGALPGGGHRPDRRARGADGRHARDRRVVPGDRARAARALHRAARPARRARGAAAQAEHGRSPDTRPPTSAGVEEVAARDGPLPAPPRPGGGARRSSSSPAASRSSRRPRTSTR